MLILKEILYPELRSIPPAERERALREARGTPFDALELFGMAAALVAVTALTRYSGAGLEADQRFVSAMMNFAVAIPLLAATAGPFMIRRVRRGLRTGRHNDPTAQNPRLRAK